MTKTKILKKTRPLSELDAKMNPAVLVKAHKMAEQESLNIRLAMLREKYDVKQSESSNFTQTAVSKLENRKDIRISTLIYFWIALVWFVNCCLSQKLYRERIIVAGIRDDKR